MVFHSFCKARRNVLSCPKWLPSSPSCNRCSAGFTRGSGRTILGFSFFDLSFGQIRSTLSFNSSNSCCAHIALEMGLRERSSPGDGLGLPSPILAITELISGSMHWAWAISSVVHENFFSWFLDAPSFDLLCCRNAAEADSVSPHDGQLRCFHLGLRDNASALARRSPGRCSTVKSYSWSLSSQRATCPSGCLNDISHFKA